MRLPIFFILIIALFPFLAQPMEHDQNSPISSWAEFMEEDDTLLIPFETEDYDALINDGLIDKEPLVEEEENEDSTTSIDNNPLDNQNAAINNDGNANTNSHKRKRDRVEFTCPDIKCRKTFATKKERSEHIKSAHDGKAHQCSICLKRFPRPYKLKMHQEIHNKSNYTCAQCFKIFSTENTLKSHISDQHKSTLQLTCPDGTCHQAFNAKKELSAHIKNSHDGKPHRCSICLKSFRRPSELQNHITKYHPPVQDSNQALQVGISSISSLLCNEELEEESE